ncbi:alpha-galactosidase [Mucilaginibacter sp. SP1R1]|uniref:alpha-galactosidase n=1 Tax=Mucilaginibacter sp. SP1R1 TaxID=2723091 RepID=UPI00160F231B|nr:alpha-galactosidase [Mucilaginibacter sp. SP1R1]MBB6148336.1 alpha-galactosidase [Mucilaginibacter sp. SP1R1]
MKKLFFLVISCLLIVKVKAGENEPCKIENSLFNITLTNNANALWTYHLKQGKHVINISSPAFEIDKKKITSVVDGFTPISPVKLNNDVTEYSYTGHLISEASISLTVKFRVSDKSPIVKFTYELSADKEYLFTKTNNQDDFNYLATSLSSFTKTKEIRFSDYNDKYHSYNLTEEGIDQRHFDDNWSVMGPMIIFSDSREQYLIAYEHGSQVPNRFLEFKFNKLKQVSLNSVKANYLDQQPLNKNNPYQSLWFEIGDAAGNQADLQRYYRDFMLKYISQNQESRKPYIYYNTWGRQERVKLASGKYLSSMNLATTLKEIEVAHQMGIDVYVIDAGWFSKTGDWQVNTTCFPDTLKQVKKLLDRYGMKLGLWFNPTVAALSSDMLAQNKNNVMSQKGVVSKPSPVWETEESVNICLVSPYWEKFADKLIQLSRDLGVTYFKWDGIDQYGCDDPSHFHGMATNSAQERADSYAFQQPVYMTKIIDKVCKANPEAIFDFDITEDNRCVGLQFLSAGKFFAMNNGPYFHNYDLAKEWGSPLNNGNSNMFFNPGPARGWFARSVLNYDTWIPSVLFLTHYMPDEPRSSQTVNLASLILGQNGIWGEVLKTSTEGLTYFNEVLGNYKQVKYDITQSYPVKHGETGESPEIYEKINKQTGKGVIVMFANKKGSYQYLSENLANNTIWKTEGVDVKFDALGRAIINARFDKPDAKMIFFGVK